MKIDSSHPPNRPQPADHGKPAAPASTHKASGSGGTEQAAVTHLSQAAQDPSQDIDTARVAELRQAISEGRLDIRADKIADGLIASVQDLLGRDRG